jgi:hypothetical protein
MAGKAEPINDAVAYVSGKYRDARVLYTATSQAVMKLEQELKAAREELLRLEGEVNSYAADMEHFCGAPPPEQRPARGAPRPPAPAGGETDDRGNGKAEVTAAGVSVTDRRSAS